MHVFQLLDLGALTPNIEITKPALPGVMGKGRVESADEPLTEAQFDRLHDRGKVGDLRLRNQQMHMLRHHHVADYDETISLAHLLQDFQEQIAPYRTSEQRLAMITTPGDEVMVSVAVVALQSPWHEETVRSWVG